jgi:hypothetical protein
MLAGNARIAAVINYGKNFIADVARATAGGRWSRLRFMSPHLQQKLASSVVQLHRKRGMAFRKQVRATGAVLIGPSTHRI